MKFRDDIGVTLVVRQRERRKTTGSVRALGRCQQGDNTDLRTPMV